MPPQMNKRMFEDLRKETLGETISQAGSDDDEVIPVGPTADEGFEEGNADGGEDMEEGQQPDQLANLLADTPLRKLRARSKDADKMSKVGGIREYMCVWGSGYHHYHATF